MLPGDELAHRIRDRFQVEQFIAAEISPVIGTHVGPGLLGVGGIPASFMT